MKLKYFESQFDYNISILTIIVIFEQNMILLFCFFLFLVNLVYFTVIQVFNYVLKS